MYAWRARIGLIKPTHRGKSFHFWYKRAPDGVEIVPTFVGFRRSDRQTFENAFERIEQIADDLKSVGCQLISLSGTPPVLLKGLDFEREWRDRLSQKIGLPVVSQMEPHALALVALGVKKTLGHVDEPLKTVPAVALFGGIALYYVAHVAFRWRTAHSLGSERLVAALVSLALIPVATEVDSLVALGLAAALAALLIGYESIRYGELRRRARASAAHG